ncbi:MAG TPA: sulfocyanin-like copper-binding protein [Patescibacteria group bacterium]|nr:sulfocyanin-like copper-binding protein [Patescibacteria group bacterium]
MKPPVHRIFAIAGVAVLVLYACAAAGPADTSEVPSVYVDISDFKIVTDHPTIAAGHVVVGIRNHASMLHELKVIKTDLAPDQLPVDGATAKAKEDGKVGELLNITAGASRKLVLELTPGKYVLICNIAGHYQLGMRVGLEVQ